MGVHTQPLKLQIWISRIFRNLNNLSGTFSIYTMLVPYAMILKQSECWKNNLKLCKDVSETVTFTEVSTSTSFSSIKFSRAGTWNTIYMVLDFGQHSEEQRASKNYQCNSRKRTNKIWPCAMLNVRYWSLPAKIQVPHVQNMD
jgi:hypothetical protein